MNTQLEAVAGLTAAEKAHFLEHGYVLLKGAFPREFALEQVREQFAANGMDADAPETWTAPVVRMKATKFFDLGEIAPRVQAAVYDILGGRERVNGAEKLANFMIANCFTAEGRPWHAPKRDEGWHKDGQFFRHFLDSPDQALLSIPLWSDVRPQGGGTFIAPDSIAPVARFLAEHPEGVHPVKFPFPEFIDECSEQMEAVGEAGDVYLMHGFMLHSVSANPSRSLRCISNDIYGLKEPLQFNRSNPAEFSLLEQGVLRALGVDSLDFAPTRERMRTDDYSLLGMEFE